MQAIVRVGDRMHDWNDNTATISLGPRQPMHLPVWCYNVSLKISNAIPSQSILLLYTVNIWYSHNAEAI